MGGVLWEEHLCWCCWPAVLKRPNVLVWHGCRAGLHAVHALSCGLLRRLPAWSQFLLVVIMSAENSIPCCMTAALSSTYFHVVAEVFLFAALFCCAAGRVDLGRSPTCFAPLPKRGLGGEGLDKILALHSIRVWAP